MVRVCLIALCLATPAFADPVPGNTARGQLFHAERVEVVRLDVTGLSDQEVALLTQVAQTQKYYAAIAFAPAQGIMAEPTVMAANYHSLDSARAAAEGQCNARRSGGQACRIALEVRPAGYEARDVTLSADATAGFNRDYRRARGERALAISASTGLWSIATGAGAAEAAIAGCQGESAARDCTVVIADQ
jgi:hypothetical protein